MSAAKANARLNGRNIVTVEDVQEMAPFVVRHRLIVEDGVDRDEVLQATMAAIPAPTNPVVELAG
jgi:MoxR-like ATPase